MGIRQLRTAPRSPWQNGYAERVIGSIRRECLDHVLVLNEAGLQRILAQYATYYQYSRTHLGLAKEHPISRPVSALDRLSPCRKSAGCITATTAASHKQRDARIIGVTLDVSLHGVRGHHDDVVAMMSRPDPVISEPVWFPDETNYRACHGSGAQIQVFQQGQGGSIAVALDTLTGIGPILGLQFGAKWATSRASRAAPSWPVTPAWCRGWMPAPIDIGLAESRGKAHLARWAFIEAAMHTVRR